MKWVCAVPVESRMVELRVRSDEKGKWQWSMGIVVGDLLCEGIEVSKIGAQLTSQRAFEQRLSRAGLGRFAPRRYAWAEQVRQVVEAQS